MTLLKSATGLASHKVLVQSGLLANGIDEDNSSVPKSDRVVGVHVDVRDLGSHLSHCRNSGNV